MIKNAVAAQKPAQERKTDDDSSVEVPVVQPDDVLFGRGKRSYNHIGNARYRELLIERAPGYKANTCKRFRRLMAKEIVTKVHKRGGKFLWAIGPAEKGGVTESTRWKMIKSPALITKVKQALRDMALSLEVRAPKETKTPPKNDYISSPECTPTVPTPSYLQGPSYSALSGRLFASGEVTTLPLPAASFLSTSTPMPTSSAELLLLQEQRRIQQMRDRLLLLRHQQEQAARTRDLIISEAKRRFLLREAQQSLLIRRQLLNNNNNVCHGSLSTGADGLLVKTPKYDHSNGI